MNLKSKHKRLSNLLNKYDNVPVNKQSVLNELANNNETSRKKYEIYLEIHLLCEELKCSLVLEKNKKVQSRIKRRNEYNKKPIPNNRDNKDTKVGSGGFNKNMVRYPSKKRSIKTWKKFYILFPELAIKDEFDGKSSTKMK